ncbi:sigma-70 family RNA polymerase sigma factor [Altererythrobacter soli]|uniref:Sigma-70 family RNA polymerase sigma factor n=1 Tax=Croceibacterium soli TaxID=1739690 RepID=A0A6I4USJ7_9SPHN|nr:RNA polymerase sigma factor [Croceibacterium soli]MXP40734.1 sigma-70 family RNA polymerase sigma factor [Croceibacterium soli]
MKREPVPMTSQAAGKSPFLDELYRLHQGELCAYVRRKFGNGPPEPEDVVQAAFLRFAATPNCSEIPNPAAYLKLTARNLVIDAHRRDGTARVAARHVRIVEENNHDSSAEDVLSSKQELERLAVIVAELKPKERVAFLLHRIDGLGYAEIARRMRISESGARLLVNKALETCVARMGKPR